MSDRKREICLSETLNSLNMFNSNYFSANYVILFFLWLKNSSVCLVFMCPASLVALLGGMPESPQLLGLVAGSRPSALLPGLSPDILEP